MSYSQWLMNDVAEAVGWALVHSVWQGVAVALILAVVLHALRRGSPAGRYALACMGLAAVVVGFGVTAYLKWPEARIARIELPTMPVVMPVEDVAVDGPFPAFSMTPPPRWSIEQAMP